jgi:hypothetical protein
MQLARGVNGTDKVIFMETTLHPLMLGINLLEGDIPGQIVMCFPLEPSGYLHVRHANKVVLLNAYYTCCYKGPLIAKKRKNKKRKRCCCLT